MSGIRDLRCISKKGYCLSRFSLTHRSGDAAELALTLSFIAVDEIQSRFLISPTANPQMSLFQLIAHCSPPAPRLCPRCRLNSKHRGEEACRSEHKRRERADYPKGESLGTCPAVPALRQSNRG